MLILTRRPGEAIRIADDIIIEVVSINGNQIRLAIDCPKEIPVHRGEIYAKIQKQG